MRKIIVCLDRSSLSEQCLPYAVDLARAFGSSITLLSVLEPPQHGGALRATDALEWEISRQEASSYLARIEAETARTTLLAVDSRVEQGRAAERIVSVARELEADLTVLCHHGEGGPSDLNLGSTAQQVMSAARGSVLLGRCLGPRRSDGPASLLVPLDGSPRTESVLPTVVRIARSRKAEVLLVHVVSEPQRTAVLSTDEDLTLALQLAARLEAGAARYLDQIRERVAREVAVRVLVLRATNEREALLGIVDRENVELIVVSAHGATCNRERSFGNVSEHLIAHATVPVLVLQDLAWGTLAGAGDSTPAPALRASFAPESV